MKLIKFILIYLLLFISLPCWAGYTFSLESKKLPPFFWHWIYPDGLNQAWRLEELNQSGKLPLPHVKEHFMLANQIPELVGRGGLFVWTHPIAGMGTNENELYGSTVIKIQTYQNKKFNVLEIDTKLESSKFPKVDLKDIDVIHHRHFQNGSLFFEEYVILKQDAVRDFTADPKLIRPIIKPYYDSYKAGAQILESDAHFPPKLNGKMYANSDEMRKIFLARLDNYMNEGIDKEIPDIWKGLHSNPSRFKGAKSCVVNSIEPLIE